MDMLENPNLDEALIRSRLAEEYACQASQVEFLPLGADTGTVVYRVTAQPGGESFLKLRRGSFPEICVTVPRLLHARGIRAIIAPLETRAGRLWAQLGEYRMVLYPFIAGKDAYEVALSAEQWVEFGKTLRAIHDSSVPPGLAAAIPHEDYSPHWRERVREFQQLARRGDFADPEAIQCAAVIREQRGRITSLVDRAEELAGALSARPLAEVLCHTDIHPGNLHITPGGELYIVDWDNPVFAPRERDLMLVGGCSTWKNALETELFYQGYGPVNTDRSALTYYRCDRVIRDIAEFGEQLLLSTEGGPDRAQGLMYFKSSFEEGHEIDLALG